MGTRKHWEHPLVAKNIHIGRFCSARKKRLRCVLAGIGHAATELVLTRQCADVSRLVYQMRINGDRIQESLLANFDGDLRASLEIVLGSNLPDAAWWQAALGVGSGGLGLRQAQHVALGAFVASRLASRPHVQTLAEDMNSAGLGATDVIMAAYDERSLSALKRLLGELPPDAGCDLLEKLENAGTVAQEVWDNLLSGTDSQVDEEQPRRSRRAGVGARVLPDDGDMDAEHPDSTARGRTLRIQRIIMEYIDKGVHDTLLGSIQDAGDATGSRRLRELSHPDVDHTWLWRLNKHRGSILSEEEFIEALRLRLGCAGPIEPTICQLCGDAIMDSRGAHAMCCAKAESTVGHYKVTNVILTGVQQVDPGAETEVRGLIPGTDLRPADILTVSVGGGSIALDIGICSPDAQHAGDDCTASMYSRKTAYYAPHAAALDRQNISYQPLTFSAFGRPHPQSTAFLRTLSKQIARRRGCSDAGAIYASLARNIGTEISRRAARQVLSCWPNTSDLEPDG